MSSIDEKEVEKIAKEIHQSLKKKITTEKLPILLYKPLPAPIDRIKNKFRWRIIVKCKIDENIIKQINSTIEEVNNQTKNKTRIIVDVNPSNML